MLLFSMKLRYPDRVFLLRGNHEVRNINMIYGFASNCISVFNNIDMWENFNEVFDLLPIAALVDNKIFCVHGGLSPKLQTLESISIINRFTNGIIDDAVMDLLWSDPNDFIQTFAASPRGAGCIWGELATQAFLQINNLELIVRAHELQMGGYMWQHGDKVLTVFSASNYCYRLGNDAAVLQIENDQREVIKFSLQDMKF